MLANAETWFEAQRREHLAVTVSYQPAVGLPRECRATLITGRWEALNKDGQIVRIETRDFIIHRDELPQDPKRGDRVVVTENGVTKTYEVSIPAGADNPWRWSDRSERIRRIHTMAVASATQTPNTQMLVRASGVSAAAAITDEQIKSQLTMDMGTGRGLARQLVASSQYAYVVLPDSFGTPTFRVNGFVSTAWELTTRPITFDGQAARSYRVYRSTYAVTGILLVEVS